MSEYRLSYADLSGIKNAISGLRSDIATVYGHVDEVDNHVGNVEDSLNDLAQEFHRFVRVQMLANRNQVAETRLVKIRQELETKFGHYAEVRRTMMGILQATDVGIVRQETVSTASENLMLSAPGYWLAPCLVALAAWISDDEELANKALREAIKRDDEKTSLFFSLLCRRADRKLACIKWVQRYLERQDERKLDRKAVVVLAAYANGLWGNDSENIVYRQLNKWLERLSAEPGFTERQQEQWSKAIRLHLQPLAQNDYQYLPAHSPTWPALEKAMQGAELHKTIEAYFATIFAQATSTKDLIGQLDEIMMVLVTAFDDEELPLREQEKLEELVVKFQGDEDKAKRNMEVEKTAFETHKDFTQLLTDAAMNPEQSHADPATQKFAISLSKDWILQAYRDVVAENRQQVPHEIEIEVQEFKSKTIDGTNETEVLKEFDLFVDEKKRQVLANKELSSFTLACRFIGYSLGIIGFVVLFKEAYLYGLGLMAAGLFMHQHYLGKHRAFKAAQAAAEKYEEYREPGKKTLRAILAEVVDYRNEFAEKDKQSQQVTDFLEKLSPEQYVRHLEGATRRVQVNGGM